MFLGKLVSIILSAFPVHPSSSQKEEDIVSKVASLEAKVDALTTETPNETCGATTALARPILDSCGSCPCTNWYVSLSALLWHVKVGGSSFAYSTARDAFSLPVVGSIKQVDFHWDRGFRAGLGYQFAHGGWDLYFQYTYFSTHGSKHAHSGSLNTLIPLRGSNLITDGQGDFVFCKGAKSQFEVENRVIELQLGRDFFIDQYLSFRPYIGLGGRMFYLDQKSQYFGGDEIGGFLGVGNNTVHIRDANCFWGVGSQTGCSSNWHLGKGVSLFGDFTMQLFYGRFKVHHLEKYSLTYPRNVIYVKNIYHAFSPAFRFLLGLQYDVYFNDYKNHFRLKVSYDVEYLLRANQMQKVDYTISQVSTPKFLNTAEDVSFHGAEINFRFDF